MAMKSTPSFEPRAEPVPPLRSSPPAGATAAIWTSQEAEYVQASCRSDSNRSFEDAIDTPRPQLFDFARFKRRLSFRETQQLHFNVFADAGGGVNHAGVSLIEEFRTLQEDNHTVGFRFLGEGRNHAAGKRSCKKQDEEKSGE